jgi:hypothetical protein
MNRILAKSLLISVIAGIMGCLLVSCRGGKGATQNTNQTPSPTSSQQTGGAYDHWLDQKKERYAYLAISEETLGDLIKAEASNQAFHEISNLYTVGRVFGVDRNTPIEILENKGVCMKVRILEGAKKGKIGWIQAEFVKSKNSFF